MRTTSAQLGWVTERLATAGCIAAAEEAEELVAASRDRRTLEDWISRREQGEPLAWITGTVQFCGHRLHVDHGVYVPRLQSETLADRAALLLREAPRSWALDLCTGAGAIAAHMTAAAQDATVIGVDIDGRAALCARRNGVMAVQGDLDKPLRPQSIDIVTAVAPYVPTAELRLLPVDVQRYEPRLSLDGGGDGLNLIRRVIVASARLLRNGGWLLVELGGRQDQALRPLLAMSGFDVVESWFDDEGDLRGIVAVRL